MFRAGLPPNDPDFFCNTTLGSCYQKNATSQTYANAVTMCASKGGSVVTYTGQEEQLLVEKTISPTSYWLGITKVRQDNNRLERSSETKPETEFSQALFRWRHGILLACLPVALGPQGVSGRGVVMNSGPAGGQPVLLE